MKPREEIVKFLFGSCLESQLNHKKISFNFEHLCGIFTVNSKVINLNLVLMVPSGKLLIFVIEGRNNSPEWHKGYKLRIFEGTD